MTLLRFLFALPVCLVALFLPYRARVAWFGVVAWWIRLPYVWFGRLARYLTDKSAESQ